LSGRRLGLGLVAAASLCVPSASAETVNCTAITALPYTISASGVYCLTGDININIAGGSAIDIQANSVIVDLNGHKIGNLAAGPATVASGIHAASRQNITIKNGTIRGFYSGIELTDPVSQGHVIEGVRLGQNTVQGIYVEGRGLIIRNNQVVATGGTSLSANANAYGIRLVGLYNRVINNDVITVTKQGTGQSIGIFFGSIPDLGLAVNNRITGADVGISMQDQTKFRDNVTTGVTTPYQGGINVGNNN